MFLLLSLQSVPGADGSPVHGIDQRKRRMFLTLMFLLSCVPGRACTFVCYVCLINDCNSILHHITDQFKSDVMQLGSRGMGGVRGGGGHKASFPVGVAYDPRWPHTLNSHQLDL